MKTIEITGKNYQGSWTKERTACRGIILDGDQMLLSYETLTDQWMIPGGGIEGSESDRECCIREIAEETGVLVEPSECLLQIVEYYPDAKWINRYFICRPVGRTAIKRTKRETEVGMEPRWIPIAQIREIFSRHDDFAAANEMRRGLYMREYMALTELLGS